MDGNFENFYIISLKDTQLSFKILSCQLKNFTPRCENLITRLKINRVTVCARFWRRITKNVLKRKEKKLKLWCFAFKVKMGWQKSGTLSNNRKTCFYYYVNGRSGEMFLLSIRIVNFQDPLWLLFTNIIKLCKELLKLYTVLPRLVRPSRFVRPIE